MTSLMQPTILNFKAVSYSIIFGIITPGESTIYAKGFSDTLIPKTDLVVQGNGVDLANAFLLCKFG